VTAECARLGMKVILYDEGAYPSGSACGAVVAENPDFASRCLGMWDKDFKGPWRGFWRPNTGRALLDRHVATVLARVGDRGRIEARTARVLPARAHEIFEVVVPRGCWKAMSVWDVASGGHVRGIYPEHESQHATAPASGDILNPEAVACFLRLTHDAFWRHLRRHFGTTILAMFTDEPHPLGKGPFRVKHPRTYTGGFVDWIARRWDEDPRAWLPSLWLDYGEGTEEFRRRYERAVQERLREVFYGAQRRWCERHGIALTGHPAASDEMRPLHDFHIPGQDMVWRAVLPDSPSALEGPASTAAKAATSAARAGGRRRILTELCGAYGWRHSLDELKWLFDWHLVRGNNLLNPHAVFYSIRERRAWESEPDLGVHNAWWPKFPRIAAYGRRLCWLLTDCEHVCEVAVVGNGDSLPWQAAKALQQAQVDFLYLDDTALASGKPLARFRVAILDGDPPLSPRARAALRRLRVLRKFASSHLPRDLRISPGNPDLRFIHVRKGGKDFYLLVNEGEKVIEGRIRVRAGGAKEWWDPWTGTRSPVPEGPVRLRLERRASVVLAVDPSRKPSALPAERPRREIVRPVRAKWRVRKPGGRLLGLKAPGDWARQRGFELFTGTLAYEASLEVPSAAELWLDLGRVGEIAELRVDGRVVGACLWAPYRFRFNAAPGRHRFEVRVTNSMANEYEGAQLPSGLMGPVRWVLQNP
ncbi:MAG: hypothetical protein ACOYMV_12850, partial [Verrucomicrobiia bacterium]